MERLVELTVTRPVQPVTVREPAAGWDRTGAGELRERGLAADPARPALVVAGRAPAPEAAWRGGVLEFLYAGADVVAALGRLQAAAGVEVKP